jgi:pimeloyl-ACP methyl ester carboxylesterase
MTAPGPDSHGGSGPGFFRGRRVLSVLVTFGALLLLAAAAVHWLQRWATFPSPPLAAARPAALGDAGGEAMWLEANGNRTEAWLLPAATDGRAPLLIYTHGNGELIDFWAGEFAPLRAAGIHVLLVEYPGYGRSRGRPSEASITATLLAAYDRLRQDPRVDAARIAGHGRSLGGGAIAQLAARRPMAALVLESTFTSLADIIRGFGIPDWLITNSFDTRAALATFDRPVLLLHGRSDVNIPVTHAEALEKAIPRATLRLMDCGHNDCPRQWDVVLGFLAGNGVCRRSTQEARHEQVHDDRC